MQKILKIDFLSGSVAHRFKFGGGRGQALPKAIGMKSDKNPKVIDATAGLGRDSFLLASLGAEVIMIERSKTMYEALSKAMEQALKVGGDVGAIIKRMTLMYGDAKDLLPTLKPQIILIDPMHPERKNSALVKKEMRLIREIVGADEDASELVEIALKIASKRVVLKWPQKADPIANIRPPSHQILGKSTRYDVFMI
jgi:16S rRNA (guanine1516-N2)-methyltransferase